MKKILFLSLIIFSIACGKTGGGDPGSDSGSGTGTGSGTGSGTSSGCGTYNGKTLHKGPDGGCYYINSNGNKTYVDRSKCRC